jgi:hypothetical protein
LWQAGKLCSDIKQIVRISVILQQLTEKKKEEYFILVCAGGGMLAVLS